MKYCLLFLLLVIGSLSAAAQCGGMDIFIANDQSGSVDANENSKSREFIAAFTQSLPLSVQPGGYRIAIADWDYNGGWVQFNFPRAGRHFTTDPTDILYYAAAPRVLTNGTDVMAALRHAYEAIVNDPDGRPKMILLMTDAIIFEAQPALSETAAQIKASGIYIAILSISTPFSPVFADAASPGGYFVADSYDLLVEDAQSFTAGINAAACLVNTPSFDLDIKLSSFIADNCYPGPGTFTLQYEIKNRGNRAWNDKITVSLYGGDLYEYGTALVTVIETPLVHLEPDDTYTGTFSGVALQAHSTLTAIANFDGAGNAISIPVFPFELFPLLKIPGERSSINNYSNLVRRVNNAGCIPIASLDVRIQPDSNGCGDMVGYAINICNNGTQDARIEKFAAKADPSFSLVQADMNITDVRSSHSATYLGGMAADYAYSAAADPFGAIYMAGQTNSSNNIATPGAHRTSNGGTQDAFLVKLNATGTRLWGTYFGGTGPENGYSAASDMDGNSYLTGETSISNNLATAGAYQLLNKGNYDAYLAKFNSNGAVLWSTYFGGTGADYGRSVITDKAGNVYLAGITASTSGIASPGAHQINPGGGNDAFIAKFNADGVLQWSSYYGGNGTESGFGLATDAAGNVYLTGVTASTSGIATAGSFQPAKAAGNDAYLVKFNSNGVRQWGTYVGGNNSDNATAISIDSEGHIYITGNTSSTNIGTAGAFQSTTGGGTDAFVASFDADGQLRWTTYYGGAGTENGRHVNASKDGFVYLSGTTTSTVYIASAGALQENYNGNTDAFLVKFTSAGERIWGTYFGGAGNDVASVAVTDALNKIYLVGATQSTGLGTPNAHQQTYGGGGNDAFLLAIDEKSSFIIEAGECAHLYYYYDVSHAAPGTYDFSCLLDAEKMYSTDPDPIIMPEASGFDGALHTTEDITVAHTSPACGPGDKVAMALDIPSARVCANAAYTTATVSIYNSSGMIIRGASLEFELTGDAKFASEWYNAPSGLRYGRPVMTDPGYPNIPFAIMGKTGRFVIPFYEIPPGTSTLKVDIVAGQSNMELSVFISGISAFFNVSGKTATAVSSHAITISPLPVISGWNVAAAINAGDPVIINDITVADVQAIHWSSFTTGDLANDGTLQQPALNYTPSPADIANGFVQLSLTALNADGCDVSVAATIRIDQVKYDYGDAPAVYDGLADKIPAAAATLHTGLYLGEIAPSADAIARSSPRADGDGREEDALADRCVLQPVPGTVYTVTITATNLSDSKGYISGFIDWNNDGDFRDTDEKSLSLQTALPRSGRSLYTLRFNCPMGVSLTDGYLLRLRLSTDSFAVKKQYGPAAQGETEDHWLKPGRIKKIFIDTTICRGTGYSIGNHFYTEVGMYSDTLITAGGCDSIVYSTLTVRECGDGVCGPFVPTAFSPNGDGRNDRFAAVINCPVTGFRLVVFNRWGEKVFETTDPATSWDGRWRGVVQPGDVFVWHCSYTRDGQAKERKGTVVLVR